MNEWSESIRLGSVRHADSHRRDRSTAGLDGLRPDRLDWGELVVVEEKATSSHLEAATAQAVFYALMLSSASRKPWRVRLYVSARRRYDTVALDDEALTRMEGLLDVIARLREMDSIPPPKRVKACGGCSNAEFCWLDERGN